MASRPDGGLVGGGVNAEGEATDHSHPSLHETVSEFRCSNEGISRRLARPHNCYARARLGELRAPSQEELLRRVLPLDLAQGVKEFLRGVLAPSHPTQSSTSA